MFDRFLNKYPYTDFHELNLDWVISEINKVNSDLASLEERVLAKAIEASKEYVDEEVEQIRNEFLRLENEVIGLKAYVDTAIENQNIVFEQKIATLQNNYDQFVVTVQAQVTLLNNRVDELREEINNDIIGVNARTDLLIQQNNEYILEEVAKGIVNATVINYFTGNRITVQEMFDYLASLHADNAISYNELANKNKTYTEYGDLNITYTQLALNGNILIN